MKPQKTPHTSAWRASYGMSFVNILDKIDRVITAPHCITKITSIVYRCKHRRTDLAVIHNNRPYTENHLNEPLCLTLALFKQNGKSMAECNVTD